MTASTRSIDCSTLDDAAERQRRGAEADDLAVVGRA